MIRNVSRATAGVLAASVCVAQARAADLQSPWSLKAVELTDRAYVCPAVPVLPRDIVAYDFYSDAKHSVTDPARKAQYEAAALPFTETTKQVEKAADTFQKNGSAAAAKCVVDLLATDAAANAMTGSMSSNQAEYVRNWTLGGLAVALLKVQTAHAGTAEQDAAIEAWIKRVAAGVKGYFEPRRDGTKTDAQNNHLYWAGFAVMAAGIAANDRSLYAWGVGTFKDGVGRIQPDGTLPLEMARGQRALHYHLFACAPLVTMAELGEANGDDLYAYDHNKLHLLVARSLSGLVKNDYFSQKAGAAQDTPGEDGKVKPTDVEWATPFVRRFPDPMMQDLLKRGGVEPYGYLGGLPPS